MRSEQLGAPAQFVELALRIWERVMAPEGSITSAAWDGFK